jgi:hypothetical protein
LQAPSDRLQKTARERNLRLAEVARRIVDQRSLPRAKAKIPDARSVARTPAPCLRLR